MTNTLLSDLHDPDPMRRERALRRALNLDVDKNDERLCAAVVDQLASENLFHRLLAISVLKALECRWTSLLPRLLQALQDPSAEVREWLLQLLRDYPFGDGARPVLEPLLHDPVLRVRTEAASVIWSHFHDAKAVAGVVRQALDSTDTNCLVDACQILGEMGAVSLIERSRLRELAEESHPRVRANALHALRRLGEDPAILLPLCHRAKEAEDPHLRFVASRMEKALPSANQGSPA